MALCKSAKLKVVEFYAGIGGYHYALRESGVSGEIVASIDINTNTTRVYSQNFPSTPHLNRNICGLTAEELDRFAADVFLLSPPCQPFTRQGNQLDNKDRRTDSFFHLMHTFQEMRSLPQYVLMENVKGFEGSQTRNEFVGVLKSLEYSVREYLLSPSQFGIPNSRLRYYLLAKRKPLQFPDLLGEWDLSAKPLEDIRMIGYVTNSKLDIDSVTLEPDLNNGSGPILEQKSLTPAAGNEAEKNDAMQHSLGCSEENYRTLSEYLEGLDADELKQFLVPDKILQRYATALDIVREDSRHSCCFTKAYGNYAVGTGSILQHSLDETALEGAFMKFSKFKEKSDFVSALECLRGLNLRYFTPKEVANLMCFPEEFSLPSVLSVRQCYKALGNSLNVKVVSLLIRYLIL